MEEKSTTKIASSSMKRTILRWITLNEDSSSFKTAGWLSNLYAAGFTLHLISPIGAYYLMLLFSLTIFPYVFLKLGEYLNSSAGTKKTILFLIAVHISSALLPVTHLFLISNEQITKIIGISSLLAVIEGILFCLLGRELNKLKPLKSNGEMILLGITYMVLGVFGFRMFARLLVMIFTVRVFYYTGKLFLYGEEQLIDSNFLSKFIKRIIYILVCLFLFVVLPISIIDYYSMRTSNIQEISYTKLLQEIDQETIVRVSITDRYLRGKLRDGQEFSVILPQDASDLIDTMRRKNIEIRFEVPPNPPWWTNLLEK